MATTKPTTPPRRRNANTITTPLPHQTGDSNDFLLSIQKFRHSLTLNHPTEQNQNQNPTPNSNYHQRKPQSEPQPKPTRLTIINKRSRSSLPSPLTPTPYLPLTPPLTPLTPTTPTQFSTSTFTFTIFLGPPTS
ncbi:hypothetical protein L207DRAFT_301531 [Hyaloscypha variabilis F]|uniref:Uncharacterized protein n=1 Tax=Hyaloscypha variabilis (strain UAMH 11265 / GT02V1 / F) TaxID=1149755 RepID=A0A2J6RYP2_HYAVF|nr:hypothetical protein L207DRAFT_301531 [Hyaloscypha variabilis F]